ncbi:hypothetical protein SAMN05428944_5578 [Streptomyces sp. 1222.5]|nr:hypothetical protein BX260_2518 [Streptomyces sp. 5112.2]SEC90947.1 hypothetical protein SAMN05428944_5578 [Streptomyces sp. 1222.5]
MMADVDERSWSEAIGMYARRYTIAKVTRRDHEDWAQDVYTLMRGDTPDARGWQVNDPLADEFERLDDPFYPFVELPADLEKAGALKARVYEIPRSSAKKLLVALSTLWLNVEETPEFEERRGELERKADIILTRFPEGSRFYANTGRDSAHLDYYERISSCTTISRHGWDLGLFLVSGTEVGMVWSFHAW